MNGSEESKESSACGSFQSLFPLRDFDFPLSEMTTHHKISTSVCGDQYTDVKFLCHGSNALTFTAFNCEKRLVIKMLKQNLENRIVAEQEMNLEMMILTKADHPNIIRIHGAGDYPRKFIAIDYLGGGTLSDVIRRQLASFPKETAGLPLKSALHIALQLASALKYLHHDLHSDAMVIHRGTEKNRKQDLFIEYIYFGITHLL